MRKGAMALISVSMLIVVGLCGCNGTNTSSTDDRFVGTWISDTYGQYEFFSDGTCVFWFNFAGIWKIKDNKLVITVGNNELIYSYDYYFSSDGNTLYLDGNSYTKQ